jgi:hypothetical protein
MIFAYLGIGFIAGLFVGFALGGWIGNSRRRPYGGAAYWR